MLDKISNFFIFKCVDKYIKENNFELALEKLNFLIKDGFMPAETFLKRGQLCHKLLMLDDAYSDFTYVITHCVKNQQAYYERMKLNYEIANYEEVITDSEKLSEQTCSGNERLRYKFLSYIFLNQTKIAKEYIMDAFGQNKYKVIQFILNEVAKNVAENELAKSLKLLEIIELTDSDNPIKIFNEAKIYGLAGENDKERELFKKLDSVFPKYFISHFRFTDMYQERDLLETCFLLELKIFDKQNFFAYPMSILEGYKYNMEGHIIDSKEAFERAIQINPNKPEAYVLLAQTLQLMSDYDSAEYKHDAEENYKKAMAIYQRENLTAKIEDMRRQIKHLNSTIIFK